MSREPDLVERERAAFASLAEHVEAAEENLDPEEIWSAVAGEVSPKETGRFLDRAAESAEVTESWRLARELQRAARDFGSAEENPRVKRQRIPFAFWAGIAATLLLVVGLWPEPRPASSPAPPPYRSTDVQGLTARIEDGIALPRGELLLRWNPAPGDGWSYTVTVTDEKLQPLVRREDLAEPEYLVPAEPLGALEGGSRLYWRVEAENPDGRRMSSPTFIVNLQ